MNYDSLNEPSSSCLEVAEKILGFLRPETQLPASSCHTYQDDEYSCGQFVLHYWEGEVRQFLGQGWCIGRPYKKVVVKLRQRMIAVPKDIEEFIKKDCEKVKKKTETLGEVPQYGPQLPAAEDALIFLAGQANVC